MAIPSTTSSPVSWSPFATSSPQRNYMSLAPILGLFPTSSSISILKTSEIDSQNKREKRGVRDAKTGPGKRARQQAFNNLKNEVLS